MFELITILCRIVFVVLGVYFSMLGVFIILDERKFGKAAVRNPSRHLAQRVVIALFHCTAFLLLAYEGDWLFNRAFLIFGMVTAALLMGAFVLAAFVYKKSNPLLWNTVFFLIDIGIIMLVRLDFETAERQLIWVAMGLAAMFVLPLLLSIFTAFEKLEYVYLALGIGLILSPFLFGKEIYGAVNWVQIGGFSFQPSEIVKCLYVVYAACVLRKKPTLPSLLFFAAASAAIVCSLVLQKDLGGALIFFLSFMMLVYIATGSELLFLSGLLAASGASFVAYRLFSHIRVRVAAWQNPWASPDDGGYQIIQSLFAMGSYGWLGSGLNRGMPLTIPVVKSDFIYAAICEEMGTLFGILILVFYLFVLHQGVTTALKTPRRFYGLLAIGFTVMLLSQTFLIIGGVTKLIPLTGVTLPFVSYGGTSMFVALIMVGVIQWVNGLDEGESSDGRKG